MGSFTFPPFLHDLVHYLAPVNNFVYDHLEPTQCHTTSISPLNYGMILIAFFHNDALAVGSIDFPMDSLLLKLY